MYGALSDISPDLLQTTSNKLAQSHTEDDSTQEQLTRGMMSVSSISLFQQTKQRI